MNNREFENITFIVKFRSEMELIYTTDKKRTLKLTLQCMQVILDNNPQELIPFGKVVRMEIKQMVFHTTIIPDHDSYNRTANFIFYLCYGFRNVVINVQESWCPLFDSLKIQMFQTRGMFPFVFPFDVALLDYSLKQISLRT